MDENKDLQTETNLRQQRRIDNTVDFIFICLGLIIISLVFKFCWWLITL